MEEEPYIATAFIQFPLIPLPSFRAPAESEEEEESISLILDINLILIIVISFPVMLMMMVEELLFGILMPRMISLFVQIADTSVEQQEEVLIHGQVELLCGVIMISSNAHMFSLLPIKAIMVEHMELTAMIILLTILSDFVSFMTTQQLVGMMFASDIINRHIKQHSSCTPFLVLVVIVLGMRLLKQIVLTGSPTV